MFIEQIMRKILEPVSKQYKMDYEQAKQMPAEDIYKELISHIQAIDGFDTELHGTTIVATPGCHHNVRDGYHCGCSFCDWNESHVANPAQVLALREKDSTLYKKMQYESFRRLRRVQAKPKPMEEFAIHDCFDPNQISIEEMQYLLDEMHVFSDRPPIGLLQVRAENVNDENILKWKVFFKKSMTLGIGVETGYEWLRNHWLNKQLDNMVLENAIETAHGHKCFVCGNILMTLPGLTDLQNQHQFMQTIRYLDQIGCDSIMISPLVRKKYTLQNYLKQDDIANPCKLLYNMAENLYQLHVFPENIKRKIMFSILNFNDFFNQFCMDKYCKPVVQVINPMLSIGGMKNINDLANRIIEFRGDNDYADYMDQRSRQADWDGIKQVLSEKAEELCSTLIEPTEHVQLINEFVRELQTW